jgi:hypothetical protein
VLQDIDTSVNDDDAGEEEEEEEEGDLEMK